MNAILRETNHRPWALPRSPWIMAQTWHDLLFAHWRVHPAVLRPLIPGGLELETFDGSAWLGVVPFRMSRIRLRATPALPWLSAFSELNVRTYVTAESKPGVWFFSLDAGNPIAVAIARAWFHLPYFRARMRCVWEHGWLKYRSERTHRGAPTAALNVRYQPIGNAFKATRGSLEYFLTERYCLYSAWRRRLYRGEIHHAAWELQSAEAEFAQNTMATTLGMALLGDAPLLHFARLQEMVAWAPRRIF
jgi:uncharacterized protein YqjF (DUF2071 family)